MPPGQDFDLNINPGIFVHLNEVELPIPISHQELSVWLFKIAAEEKKTIHSLHIIFCSDNYLEQINQNYLLRSDYTDIITFPYNENPIEAELYISIDRIIENSGMYSHGDIDSEIHRVIAHGLLHLCGYPDKTKDQKKLMRKKESYYLQKKV